MRGTFQCWVSSCASSVPAIWPMQGQASGWTVLYTQAWVHQQHCAVKYIRHRCTPLMIASLSSAVIIGISISIIIVTISNIIIVIIIITIAITITNIIIIITSIIIIMTTIIITIIINIMVMFSTATTTSIITVLDRNIIIVNRIDHPVHPYRCHQQCSRRSPAEHRDGMFLKKAQIVCSVCETLSSKVTVDSCGSVRHRSGFRAPGFEQEGYTLPTDQSGLIQENIVGVGFATHNIPWGSCYRCSAPPPPLLKTNTFLVV